MTMDSIYIFLAKYLIFFIAIAVLVYGWKLPSNKRLKYAVFVIKAGVLAVVLAKIASMFYYHPRPFVASGIKPLIEHSADNGFPSEHTTYSMILALCLYAYDKKWGYWAIAAALLVGFGRIMVHVHSIIDILGGILIAALSAYIAKKLIDKYYDRFVKA